ncbi:MAG TPA: hypothetical protein VM390_11920 [Acidimicrobiales bacterium]|jgi:hypothetical protein|nr:hypothetical protein [Acidimicrobiales bacterium]
MASSTTAQHERVVGVYRSAEEARDAIAELERAGVPPRHISLAGTGAKKARRKASTVGPDDESIRHSAAAVRRGVLIGALVGATAGFAVGMLIVATTDADQWRPEIWVAVIGLIAGVITGGMIGYRVNVGTSEAWLLTFKVPPGRVCVAVRPDTDDEEGSATEALRRTGPEKVLAGFPNNGGVEQIC